MITTAMKAIYKNGMLEPLQKIDLEENEKVDIILSPTWRSKKLAEVLDRMEERTRYIPDEEVERDVDIAIKKVRALKRAKHASRS